MNLNELPGYDMPDSDQSELSSDEEQIEAVKWFGKQEQAFAYMEEKKNKIPIKFGKYKFGSVINQDEFINLILESDEKIYYELLREDKPQRIFSDIDGEKLTIKIVELYKQWCALLTEVFKAVEGLPKFNQQNVRIINSSDKNKLSLHWNMTDLYFRNCTEQKELWGYVEHVIEQKYPDLCYSYTREDGKIELRTVVDLAVYTKNRAMRTIYSHKAGSKRVLKPCKIGLDRVKYLKHVNPLDYLIYAPDQKEFLNLKIPLYTKIKAKYETKESIEALILKLVPNVEIVEFSGRMFKLKTVGKRVCLINGEENSSDNCYVVWKRDGLYFGCHDSGCEGQLKHIHVCEAKVHKATNIKNLRQMASKCKTYKERSELIKAVVHWMNQKYCLIKANKTFVLEEFEDIDEEDKTTKGIKYKDMKSMDVDFANKDLTTSLPDEELKAHKVGPNTVNPFDVWLKHPNRREADKIIFDPLLYFKKDQRPYYNLFDGFAISREDVADCKVPNDFEKHPFFYHILHRWCKGDEKAYNIVLNVFAHILQKPWEKLNISIVLRSTERTGKGLPLQIFKEIIGGKYFFQPSHPKHILGDFNGQMRSALVCFLDEMVWGGDKEKAGTLKKLATEKVNYINEKFAPVVRVKNLANIIMASNEDWVVPAGATEQRWLVENVSDELAICGKQKKAKIIKEILSINIKELAKFFYERNLDGWSHRETINTQGLRDQKIQSLSVLRKWWLDCISEGFLCETGIVDDDGFDQYHSKKAIYNMFAEKSNAGKHMNNTRFWIDMKHILGSAYKQKRTMVGGARSFRIYIPSVEDCKKRWCELYNDDGWVF